MKKLVFILMTLMFISCIDQKQQVEHFESKVTSLKSDISNLEIQKQKLDGVLTSLKEQKFDLSPCESKKYVVLIEIKQKRTLGILDTENYIKDELNKFSIPIEVSEDFYNSHSVGDKLKSNFRIGSFFLKGSMSSWNVTVKEKHKVL